MLPSSVRNQHTPPTNEVANPFTAQVNSQHSSAYLLFTQVSDPRHVLVWVGGAHYRGINCVAENNERNFYIHVIFPNSPNREKNTKPFPNTWDLGQE